jgi:Carboxylesterase family
VIDGTYLVSNTLTLNNSGGYTAEVAFMTGTNRDELGVDVSPIDDGANITDIFAHHLPGGVGNLQRFVTAKEFAPANATNARDILNSTIRISTDGLYTCLEQATAYSGAKHGIFKALYSFQFNRTYSTTGYSQPHCNAPKTAARPDGDPDGEYFKCHAGEQMIVFGTVRRDGLPDRDGKDVPYMQLVMDYWSAFAHNRDPNPDKEYLMARGYWNTISQIEAVGPWEEEKTGLATRLLQWNGRQEAVQQKAQCDALGLSLDYFETH